MRVNVPQNERAEELLKEVQEIRRLRLDVLAMDDLVPRPWKRRPRPNTAIIAEAAKRAIVRRQEGEANARHHQRFARQRRCSRVRLDISAPVYVPYQRDDAHEGQ